jgi:hypothetical protein
VKLEVVSVVGRGSRPYAVEVRWEGPHGKHVLRAPCWGTKTSVDVGRVVLRDALRTGQIGVGADVSSLWFTYAGARLAFFEPFLLRKVSLNVTEDLRDSVRAYVKKTEALPTNVSLGVEKSPLSTLVVFSSGNLRYDILRRPERGDEIRLLDRIRYELQPGTWLPRVAILAAPVPGRFFVSVQGCEEASFLDGCLPLGKAFEAAALLRGYMQRAEPYVPEEPSSRYERDPLGVGLGMPAFSERLAPFVEAVKAAYDLPDRTEAALAVDALWAEFADVEGLLEARTRLLLATRPEIPLAPVPEWFSAALEAAEGVTPGTKKQAERLVCGVLAALGPTPALPVSIEVGWGYLDVSWGEDRDVSWVVRHPDVAWPGANVRVYTPSLDPEWPCRLQARSYHLARSVIEATIAVLRDIHGLLREEESPIEVP